MTPQELRNSILQYAIEGKLVEQRPKEGSAEKLYNQIQAEKARLVSEKKIKKEKPLPEITDDEIPYDIPDNWIWVRVADCIYNKTGASYKKDCLNVISDNMTRVLRGGNISELSYSFKADDVMISSEFIKDDLYLKKNIIITPAVTSLEHIGKMARIDRDLENTVVGGFVLMLIPYLNNDLLSRFLLYLFSSNYFKTKCKEIVHKSGQAFYNLSRPKMMEIVIPLPPLEEQKRIVAKIEELLPIVDKYEESYNELETLNNKFPEDMKKSILQDAIQGKLVEQRPEEGDAEELYNQIQAEKVKLIAERKIKKEKPLPEITEDEIPFEIPDNWKWVRLKNIGITQTGNTPSKSVPEYFGNDVPFITPADITNGKIDYSNQKISYKGMEVARVCNCGSILQVCIGGSIGKSAITKMEITFNQQINAISPLVCDYNYVYYSMISDYFLKMIKFKAGGTATPIINKGIWDTLLIPLPPLEEQKRIVAKIEELLPLCDNLK